MRTHTCLPDQVLEVRWHFYTHTSKCHPSKTNNFKREQTNQIFFLDKNLRRIRRWLAVPTKSTVINSVSTRCGL